MNRTTDNQKVALYRGYLELFDTVTDSIYIIEKNNKIADVNLGTVKMYGYKKHEIIGKPPEKLIVSNKKYLDKFNERIKRADKGEIQRFRSKGRRKDGNIFPKDMMIKKVEHFGREVMIVTEKDISKRIETEKRLHNALKRAEDSEKIKSEFLAQISHEIRTPLNVIFSYTGFLRELIGEQKKDEYKDIFRGIKSASDRLSRTINSILDMVAIQADMLDVDFNIINLTDILQNIIRSFSSISHFKRLNFSLLNEIGDAFVEGDEYTLYKLFENLVDNAFKYTDEGGIQIRLYKSGNNKICVDVNDSGIGISEKYIPDIFKPFTQESTGYSRKYEGNGLGLALVKNYADLSRAALTVSSKLNVGSTFTVTFKEAKTVGPVAFNADN